MLLIYPNNRSFSVSLISEEEKTKINLMYGAEPKHTIHVVYKLCGCDEQCSTFKYRKCFQSPTEDSEEIYKYIRAYILLKTANLI